MIAEVISLKGLWGTLVMTWLVFGFAPGAVLRLAVLMFPRGDERRKVLIAELYVVPRWERPVWVAQQLEVAAFEGIGERIRRRHLASPGEVIPAYEIVFIESPHNVVRVWGNASVFGEKLRIEMSEDFAKAIRWTDEDSREMIKGHMVDRELSPHLAARWRLLGGLPGLWEDHE